MSYRRKRVGGMTITTKAQFPWGVMVGDWVCTDHDDGLVQWRKVTPWPARYYVEARHREPWFVVDRHPPEKWASSLHPPVVSGPHETLTAAKAAYVMLLASTKSES